MFGHPQKRLALEDHGHLLVSRAIERNDEISYAIFDVAAAGKTDWTPAEWYQLLKVLENCKLKIKDWIPS